MTKLLVEWEIFDINLAGTLELHRWTIGHVTVWIDNRFTHLRDGVFTVSAIINNQSYYVRYEKVCFVFVICRNVAEFKIIVLLIH